MSEEQRRIREEITQFLIKNVSPDFIVLFGSFVKGTMREDSDIDVAFFSEKVYNDYELFLLAQKLADRLGHEVDLVQLNNASTVFQAQIVGTGETIYCTDETKRMFFEMKVLKMYAKLNEERQPIFDAIKESGSVYDR